MDAIIYFFTTLGGLLFVAALIAFLLGLLLGWLLWGKNKDSQGNYEWGYSNKDDELSKCKKECDELKKKLKNASLTTGATKKSAPANKSAANYFSSGLKSGKVKNDEKLGILYTEKPDEVDDLTQISGVAKVLSGKLNDFGVYTYRQIALWKKTQIDEFSERLTFKDRVGRDNWVGQCKKLHKEKYGEKV